MRVMLARESATRAVDYLLGTKKRRPFEVLEIVNLSSVISRIDFSSTRKRPSSLNPGATILSNNILLDRRERCGKAFVILLRFVNTSAVQRDGIRRTNDSLLSIRPKLTSGRVRRRARRSKHRSDDCESSRTCDSVLFPFGLFMGERAGHSNAETTYGNPMN